VRFSKEREGVGLLIGVATLFSAFLPNSMFLILLCLLSFGMARELGKALGVSEISYVAPLVPVLAVLGVELGIAGVLLLAFLFAYLRWSLDCLSKAVLVLIYAGFLPMYTRRVRNYPHI
jgi:phosphatidate cytidylyltransferase